MVSIVAILSATSHLARADGVQLAGAHVDYSIGAAASSMGVFRQGLDVGVMAGTQSTTGSSIGMWDSHEGMIFGASGLIGFHAYPSYVIGEIGWGKDTTLAGGAWLVGPVVRVDPQAGGGAGGRITFSLLIFEVGVRVIAIAAPSPEVQAALMVGLGVY
jgi:hypothetical protein